MKVFEAVDSIKVVSDPALGISATFGMRYGSSPETTYLILCCMDALKASLKLLFPDSEFTLEEDEEEAIFTFESFDNWVERDNEIFDLFIRALINRYTHITYTARVRHPEPLPWI